MESNPGMGSPLPVSEASQDQEGMSGQSRLLRGCISAGRRAAAAALCMAVVLLVPSAVLAEGVEGNGAAARAGVTDAVPAGTPVEALLFYAVAAVAVVSVLGVCASRSIVRMAVWLFAALSSVAMLYFLLAASFLGAIQLIVYAGGVLVLLIFGVMLTSKSPWVRFDAPKGELAAAAVVCLALAGALCLALSRADWVTTSEAVAGAAVADFGVRLVTTYLVPFEIAGVLLMIVMVGAAHLARQEEA